jgi:hypothetical protein
MPRSERASASRGVLTAAVTVLGLLMLAPPADALVRPVSPSDGNTGEHFGRSVAMDGDTLVVGAPGGGDNQGAVYVYTRTVAETWTQTAKLTASDGADGDQLGAAVAIDGTTIVAGAPGDDNAAGSVYLFDRDGAANRTQRDQLLASDGSAQDALGSAVDIDGATVVAGAPDDDNAGSDVSLNHGSVYTFTTTGAPVRFQSAKLTGSDNLETGWLFGGASLGSSVAIDGDTIVAGAPIDNFGHPENSSARRGSVYVFATGGASTRTEVAKLSVSGTDYGRLGVAVDVQGDTIVAGDDDGNDAFGTVYTFARTGATVRHETGALTPANPRQNSGFGESISMSDTFIAVGAPAYSGGGSRTSIGAGYVFTRTGAADRNETWFTGGADANGGEAYATSIVTDGDRVVGGAPYVDANPPFVQDQGRVYSSTPDLFVSKLGAGTGTVTADVPGNACESPAPCFGSYLLGDQVTLTATAAPGSHFVGWENYAPCTGTTGSCVVTMDREPQVAATFSPGAGDTTPPTASIGSGPGTGSTVTTSTVTFGFTANETSTFQCSYDGAAFAPCTTPGPGTSGSDTRSNLAEGTHTFAMRAKDLANNLSTEQARSFTVDLPGGPPPPPAGDTTAPQTTITQAPPKKIVTTKRKATVEISFSASEPATFACSVDGQAAVPCASTAKFKLVPGKHTITVVAIDTAGNRDPSPAQIRVKIKKKMKRHA